MRFHFIGDKTERLFSRGQRLLARGSFEDAIQSFDRAIASDSSYAHIYLYKALALAELERYDQAVAQIDEATRLNSRNFVFSLYLGCIHFDERRLDAAATAFRQAASLDPGNTLVSSYQLLTEYVSGRKEALARLAPQLNSLPDSFKARLLVALRADEDVAATSASAEASPSSGQSWNLLGAVRQRLRKWSVTRLDRRVQRLYDSNRYEEVLDLLRSEDLEPSVDRDALAKRAATAASKELMTELSNLEQARSAKTPKGRKELKRRAKVEERRRGLLLRLANLRDTGAPQRYRDLERWIESYRAVDSPTRTRELASQVLAEMADMARRSARLDSAIDLCQQSKSLAGAPEADWIEARSRLASGEPRLAKQLFERFGHSKSLVFSQRVTDLLRARSV